MPGFRNKEERKIWVAVIAAGGRVTRTAQGHLRIVGPTGVVIAGSHNYGRDMRNVVRQIRRLAGLDVRL